jgi:Holliday junction resolvase RusA-like endonuclease
VTLLSEEEIARGLVAAGVPREKALAEAKRQHITERHFAVLRGGDLSLLAEASTPVARAPIAWPVRLLLPWSHLVSDNERKEPYVVQTAAGPRARMRLTAKYAAALEKVANVARNKIGDAAPFTGPLAIRGLVYVPDERPHDVSNFEKLTHDALEGVLYTNDRWLHDVHWTRAGVDVDAPRAEITITPILA